MGQHENVLGQLHLASSAPVHAARGVVPPEEPPLPPDAVPMTVGFQRCALVPLDVYKRQHRDSQREKQGFDQGP